MPTFGSCSQIRAAKRSALSKVPCGSGTLSRARQTVFQSSPTSCVLPAAPMSRPRRLPALRAIAGSPGRTSSPLCASKRRRTQTARKPRFRNTVLTITARVASKRSTLGRFLLFPCLSKGEQRRASGSRFRGISRTNTGGPRTPARPWHWRAPRSARRSRRRNRSGTDRPRHPSGARLR